MNNQAIHPSHPSTVTPSSALPFVPELSLAKRQALQQATAKQYGYDVLFHDVMRLGHYAPEMVVIPAGQFEMGSPNSEFGHCTNESPQHYVMIARPFAMGRFTITANEFELFRAETEWTLRPELIWAKGNYPVINIRRTDANLFAKWLSEQTGQQYRLPTEAEWEYAARAGTSTPFAFGDSVSCKEVTFNPNFPYQEAKEKRRWYLPRCMPSITASEVGSKAPNAWGIHDMHGNVWEYTSSPWRDSHINANRDGSVTSVQASRWIVTKGGSWFDAAVFARSAARKKRFFDEMDTNLSFRLVREL
ncbi:MAG TPA: formylglycine-generating enzyme family protein [Thiothrix sp.]|nr:formylglycine-generating enzyme family protein [Thiothrix sp.]